MWNVGQPRLRWRISRAKKSSPLEITLEAEIVIEDAPRVDVVGAYMDGMRSLSSGHRRSKLPKHWNDDNLKAARILCRVPGVTLLGDKHEPVLLSEAIKANVDRILRIPVARAPLSEYGSVEGTLRTVTVDPRDDHLASKLQIIERFTQSLVDCKFDPSRSPELHPPNRIVAFGTVTLGLDGKPKTIDVDDFKIIPPESELPNLEDLRRLGIDPTNGQNSADYVSEMRDEE